MRRVLLGLTTALALLVTGGIQAVPAQAAPTTDGAGIASCAFNNGPWRWSATQYFNKDDCYSTPKANLIMQADGNLVLYNEYWQPLWASNTNWAPDSCAVFQGDGNLVVYYACVIHPAYAIWASNTEGNPGSTLILNVNGNFLIRDANGVKIWETGTAH